MGLYLEFRWHLFGVDCFHSWFFFFQTPVFNIYNIYKHCIDCFKPFRNFNIQLLKSIWKIKTSHAKNFLINFEKKVKIRCYIIGEIIKIHVKFHITYIWHFFQFHLLKNERETFWDVKTQTKHFLKPYLKTLGLHI